MAAGRALRTPEEDDFAMQTYMIAGGAALAAVSAASPRGWKRGLRHSELFFKHSGEDVSALRLYIIRGPLLIDAFTGESSGAASLIEFII